MTKLTEGKLSTAAHPPASRHVFVSAEYTMPGTACMQWQLISANFDTATVLCSHSDPSRTGNPKQAAFAMIFPKSLLCHQHAWSQTRSQSACPA